MSDGGVYGALCNDGTRRTEIIRRVALLSRLYLVEVIKLRPGRYDDAPNSVK